LRQIALEYLGVHKPPSPNTTPLEGGLYPVGDGLAIFNTPLNEAFTSQMAFSESNPFTGLAEALSSAKSKTARARLASPTGVFVVGASFLWFHVAHLLD